MLNRKASLRTQHVEPGGRWAQTPEDDIGFCSCQPRNLRLEWPLKMKIGKTSSRLMNLDIWCNMLEVVVMFEYHLRIGASLLNTYIPLWPQFHPSCAQVVFLEHHTSWVQCTSMASAVTRIQSTWTPLGCGRIPKGMFPTPCGVQTMKNWDCWESRMVLPSITMVFLIQWLLSEDCFLTKHTSSSLDILDLSSLPFFPFPDTSFLNKTGTRIWAGELIGFCVSNK